MTSNTSRMRPLSRIVLLVLTTASTLAAVSPAAASPVSIGLRGGLSLPAGELAKGDDMQDDLLAAVPLQFDLLYNAGPRLSVGAYVSYGPVLLKEDNSDGAQFRQLRVGGQALYHVGAPTASSGWVGLFVGMEQFGASVSDETSSLTTVVRGAEIGLQAGYGFAVGSRLRLGPVLSVSMARYSSTSAEATANGKTKSKDADIAEDQLALHQWITVGLAGEFSL